MTTHTDRPPLEEQIAQWRQYLRRRRAINGPDIEELEGHLRSRGIDDVAKVKNAYIEADGTISVIPYER